MPQPGSPKEANCSAVRSCQSMSGFQNVPTAPKTTSRPGTSPRSSQPGNAPDSSASISVCGVTTGRRNNRLGTLLAVISMVTNGDLVVMKSKFFAAANTDVVSALMTRCSVSTTSYDGRCTSRRSSVAGSGMLLVTSVVPVSFTCPRPRPGFVSTALVAHSLDVSITHDRRHQCQCRGPCWRGAIVPLRRPRDAPSVTSREAPRQNARARCPSVNGPASSLTRSGVCPHDYHSRTQRSRDRRPH